MFGEKIIMTQLFPYAFIPRPPENYCDENTYLSTLNKLNSFFNEIIHIPPGGIQNRNYVIFIRNKFGQVSYCTATHDLIWTEADGVSNDSIRDNILEVLIHFTQNHIYPGVNSILIFIDFIGQYGLNYIPHVGYAELIPNHSEYVMIRDDDDDLTDDEDGL